MLSLEPVVSGELVEDQWKECCKDDGGGSRSRVVERDDGFPGLSDLGNECAR